nr:MAG TPA: hypothetical protein [Bacteriophage sp.]
MLDGMNTRSLSRRVIAIINRHNLPNSRLLLLMMDNI